MSAFTLFWRQSKWDPEKQKTQIQNPVFFKIKQKPRNNGTKGNQELLKTTDQLFSFTFPPRETQNRFFESVILYAFILIRGDNVEPP